MDYNIDDEDLDFDEVLVKALEEIDMKWEPRSPERIKPFMERLTEEWEQYSDLRFIQFVNLLYRNAEYDPWNYEEEDTLQLLDRESNKVDKDDV